MAREKGISLASVTFRVKEKSFEGAPFSLQLKEEIAKDLVERIRERVIEIDPSTETGVANTVVPYFDINFFNFYELFIKGNDFSPSQETFKGSLIDTKYHDTTPKSIPTPVKKLIISLAEPFTFSSMENNINSKSMQVISSATLPKKRRVVPDDFINLQSENKTISSVDQSPTHDLDSPTGHEHNQPNEIKEIGGEANLLLLRKEKSSIEGMANKVEDEEFPNNGGAFQEQIRKRVCSKRSFTMAEDSQILKEMEKESARPKVNLPKMLVRLRRSSDNIQDVDIREDFDNESIDRRSIVSAFRPPQSVKSALHITVGSLALLFRLDKAMQRRQKFKSTQQFDQKLEIMKNIYGLKTVENSILEIKNQSISKLGKDC